MRDGIGILVFQWAFIGLFVVCIADMAIVLIRRTRREKWIERQPVQRVHARVIALHEKERVVSGLRKRRDVVVRHIRWTTGVFELQDGSTVELEIPKDKTEWLRKGQDILLEYQGDRLVRYQRLTPHKNKETHRRF